MKKKGFTMIEVVIVSAILLIIMQAVYSIFMSTIQTAGDERKKAYIDSQAKTLMDYISQSLKISWQEEIEAGDFSAVVMKIPRDKKDALYVPGNSIELRFEKYGDSIKITRDEDEETVLDGCVEDFETSMDGNHLSIKLTVRYDLRNRTLYKDFNIDYNVRKD